jgi:nitrogenase-stabilizing/protective protein
MKTLIERLQALSSAEDFFGFFGLDYDARVLQVNRLHILKRFHQYVNHADVAPVADDIDRYRDYRAALARAYRDFVESTPAQQKVFKVFQHASGTRRVPLEALRDSLADRPRRAREEHDPQAAIRGPAA